MPEVVARTFPVIQSGILSYSSGLAFNRAVQISSILVARLP